VGVSGAGLERDQDVQHLGREVDVVRSRALHPLLGDRPDRILEIDLVPDAVLELALTNHAEQDELQAKADRRQRGHIPQEAKHDADLRRRQSAVAGSESSDRRRPDVIGGIGDLLAMQDRVPSAL